MIYNKNDDRMNSSGCKDMTAYRAMKNIKKEERRSLIVKLKELANQHGHEIISIIRLNELECDDFGKYRMFCLWLHRLQNTHRAYM